MVVILYIAALFVVLYFILKHIRYDFGREFILNTFCVLQGRRYAWIRDPALARRLLAASASKGRGIEAILSLKAFRPIVSLESVDGDQWGRMKENFHTLKYKLPSLDALSKIAEERTNAAIEANELIDAPKLARLIVEIMDAWLFGRMAGHQNYDKLLAAAEEWRKEIAIKGVGDKELKTAAVAWIQDKIKNSPAILQIFGAESWTQDEYWSLLLQPFFISPVINITDVAVTLASRDFQQKFGPLKDGYFDMERLLVAGINFAHPFPVLERWFPNGYKEAGADSPDDDYVIKPNTHVFFPMDQIGKSVAYTTNAGWAAFGAGKRACGGREIATTLCTKLFHGLLEHPEKFRPDVGHNFSGRDNDLGESWGQTYFQIKLLLQILWKLIIGQRI